MFGRLVVTGAERQRLQTREYLAEVAPENVPWFDEQVRLGQRRRTDMVMSGIIILGAVTVLICDGIALWQALS